MNLRKKDDRRSLKEKTDDEDDEKLVDYNEEAIDSDSEDSDSKPSKPAKKAKRVKKRSSKSVPKKEGVKKRQKVEQNSEKSQYFSTEIDEEEEEKPPVLITLKSKSKTTLEDNVADVLTKMEVDLNDNKPKTSSSKQRKPVK